MNAPLSLALLMNLAGQRASPVYALGVRKSRTGGAPILLGRFMGEGHVRADSERA